MASRLGLLAIFSGLGLAALSGCGGGENMEVTGEAPPPAVAAADGAGQSAAAPEAPPASKFLATLRGRAHKADGSPLPGVQIKLIEPGSGLGAAAPTSATTAAADGGYATEVTSASVSAAAIYDTEYNGRAYRLWLEPLALDRGPQDAAAGTREMQQDFVLKLSGALPGGRADLRSPESYLGGSVYLEGMLQNPATSMDIADGEAVEITLAPDGPLIEGSAGKPLTFKVTYPIAPENAFLLDIPVGRYTASAKLAKGGAALRVASPPWLLKANSPPAPPGPTATIEFLPAQEDTRGKTEGVLNARLFITK